MHVIINGNPEEIGENLTVEELLKQFDLDPTITIVEKNRVILERSLYPQEKILENDSLELIRYMGGG